jgi:hypothetical protein
MILVQQCGGSFDSGAVQLLHCWFPVLAGSRDTVPPICASPDTVPPIWILVDEIRVVHIFN